MRNGEEIKRLEKLFSLIPYYKWICYERSFGLNDLIKTKMMIIIYNGKSQVYYINIWDATN